MSDRSLLEDDAASLADGSAEMKAEDSLCVRMAEGEGRADGGVMREGV